MGPSDYNVKPVKAKIRGSYLEQKEVSSKFDQYDWQGQQSPSPDKYNTSIEITTKYNKTQNMMFNDK